METTFREKPVGEPASQQEKQTWRSLATQWVAQELDNKKITPQEEAVKQTKIHRLATKHHLAAVDYLLTTLTSSGLSQFVPPDRLKQLQEAWSSWTKTKANHLFQMQKY